jgi:hypothetical protein
MQVAFLANSFHLKKTKSANFFIDFLRAEFGNVVVVPHKEAWARLPKHAWDLLVVWQKCYTPEELEAFGAQRVVLVPMYDDIRLDGVYWKKYKKFKVFCFSSTLERLLKSYGVCAWGAQYFPEPLPAPEFRQNDGLRGFFWPRVKSINWPLVRALIGSTPFEHINIHWTPDIHSDLSDIPMDADIVSGRVSTSSWNGDRSEYLKHLAESNVFFASRTAEGIGMSFLEAMAMGLCVVAPNAPTMNEYIRDGENGLLYDPEHPRPMDFSRAGQMGKAARASCEAGRREWLRVAPQLKSFLEDRGARYRPRAHPIIVVKGRGLAQARKIYRFLKRIKHWQRTNH